MRYIVLFILSFAQLSFAGFATMLVIFASAGIANGHEISEFQNLIFTAFLFLIPVSSLLVIPSVVYVALKKPTKKVYRYHFIPVVLTLLFLVYAVQFQ